ncbi:hypothetical protein LTR78_008761 [Recurvomyces mirabilis]|uniref:DUF8004 domain-containing protein n=1 Tax=Recurvomyces mirabilis TaxID=574656 RepID=A0AAE0TTA1_9PEZI|nr:hypothetical protein LTR78_008761 [Recurvomyces mirabilis]KAK5161001.1 hypothetical protein LTS14_000795 [Recurvomyces mirabilis]
MAKRLSNLFTSTDKPLPGMPVSGSNSPSSPRRHSPPSAGADSRSSSRLRKPAPVAGPGHARGVSGEYLRGGPPAPSHARASSHSRAGSGQYLADAEPSLPSLHDLQYGSPSPLLPPPPIAAAGAHPRSSSTDRSRPGTPSFSNNYSRPTTPNPQHMQGQAPMTPPSAQSEKKKDKKGLFGRSKKDGHAERGPVAWIGGHPERPPYEINGLLNGLPLPEMWDESENGNCFVYLFPQGSPGKGASFRIDSAVFAASPVLTRLAFGDRHGLNARTQHLSLNDRAETMSSNSSRDSRGRSSMMSDGSAQDVHLFLPIRLHSTDPAPTVQTTPGKKGREAPVLDTAAEDLQTLVDIRNFFAFLIGGPLVATERRASWFAIFMSISGILKTYEFSNVDGSTYGEVASGSFDAYVEELGLGDVRTSRETTIDGIVLGERMKSVYLYNEAFTHAVGKHEEILTLKSPKWDLISSLTQNRLTRAAMDLEKRVASIQLVLKDFEFPFLFTGIMSSKTSDERKEGVRFAEWKDAFLGMRKWTIAILQQRYGHWPPKASSKKNNLETSGLSRKVLKDLYSDMSAIYDLMVDRSNLTTRTVDGVDRSRRDQEDATIRGVRAVLSEYDRSSPPVKPPVPFDLPILPNLKATRSDFGTGDKKKDLKSIQKRLKDDEIELLLRASWNRDVVASTNNPNSAFVEAFRDLERKAAHHCTISEMVDLRVGQWIFMYVVLQALPMLACDAPGLRHMKGVEYFLCEPPRSGVPWASNPNSNSHTAAQHHASGMGGVAGRNTWFSVGDGGGVVSLPSDLVEHGVEGIYRRSHCWVLAERWSAGNPILNSALHEQEAINARQSEALGDSVPVGPLPGVSVLQPPPSGGLGPGYAGGPVRSQSPYSSRPGSSSALSPMPTNTNMGTGIPMRDPKRLSSIGMGLEALPLPAGVSPDGRGAANGGSPGPDGRPRSSQGFHKVDANKTFDAILGEVAGQGGGKKGRKK